MKPLTVPSNIKPGMTFYTAHAEYDDSPGIAPKYYIQVWSWVVRSIRGGKVHLVRKWEGITWIKSGFGNNAKYDWATTINSDDRLSFPINNEFLPSELFKTPTQALYDRIESIKTRTIPRFQNRITEHPEDQKYYEDLIVHYQKLISMIYGRITKAKRKRS